MSMYESTDVCWRGKWKAIVFAYPDGKGMKYKYIYTFKIIFNKTTLNITTMNEIFALS